MSTPVLPEVPETGANPVSFTRDGWGFVTFGARLTRLQNAENEANLLFRWASGNLDIASPLTRSSDPAQPAAGYARDPHYRLALHSPHVCPLSAHIF